MEESLINILIANDHILYGKGLGNAENFESTLSTLKETHIDLIIIDFHMPKGDPFVTINSIKENWPTIKIILNGMIIRKSINYFPSLLTQIEGLLSFRCSADYYVEAIDVVMKGGLYFYSP